MAVLFSAVTITSDSDQAEFLVAGIPKSYADLEGWTAFESFMNEVDTEQDIKVHVAACLYGEGEVFTATPEEVAYFTIWTSTFLMKRMVYGMSCREIIIFLALLYQPKKNTSLSAYGGCVTNATYRNINGRFTPRYSQAEN